MSTALPLFDASTPAPHIIRELSDMPFRPTLVTCWTPSKTSDGPAHVTREEWCPRATLYPGPGAASERTPIVTFWVTNIYGAIYAETGRLLSVIVEPDGPRPAKLRLMYRRPRARRRAWLVDREVPDTPVVIAWGAWADRWQAPAVITDHPVLWQDAAVLVAHWREAAARAHAVAGSSIWLDTTGAAITQRMST
jgi:hypothetical protein